MVAWQTDFVMTLLRQQNFVVRAALFAAVLVIRAQLASAQMPPPPPGVVLNMPETVDPSAKVPQFEIISVRPAKTNDTAVQFRVDGMRGTAVTAHFLLLEGFGAITQHQIVGEPSWSNNEGFDIEAKVAAVDMPALAKLTFQQRASMFQQILAERFNVRTHHEMRELPIYQLTVGKNGPKLKTSAPEPSAQATPRPPFLMFGPGKVTARDATLPLFINPLSRLLDRVTVDKTGLSGKYDFTLEWTPEGAAAPGAAAGSTSSDGAPPDIFTAIQEQLGLKLVSGKGPVDIVVIDHIERPSAN